MEKWLMEIGIMLVIGAVWSLARRDTAAEAVGRLAFMGGCYLLAKTFVGLN